VAQLNALLEQRYAQAARVQLGLQEQLGLDAVAPELQVVTVLEGERPEFSRFKGERLCGAFLTVTNGVASLSQAQLHNPGGSGAIIVLEEIRVQMPALNANVQIHLSVGGISANLSNAGLSRDTRDDVPTTLSRTIGQIRWDIVFPSGIAPGVSLVRQLASIRSSNGQEEARFDWPVILRPGYGVLVHPGDTAAGVGDNAAIVTSWRWRERAARPDELAIRG